MLPVRDASISFLFLYTHMEAIVLLLKVKQKRRKRILSTSYVTYVMKTANGKSKIFFREMMLGSCVFANFHVTVIFGRTTTWINEKNESVKGEHSK